MLYGCLNEQDCNVLEGTKVELGYYLIYSCNSGYNLNGTTVVTCSFQGKWQPAIPICTGIKLIIKYFFEVFSYFRKKI